MAIDGIFAVRLTASIIDWYGYRCFKKTHVGKKYNKDYYLNDLKYESVSLKCDREAKEKAREMADPAHPFVCEACGKAFSGWYRECPGCRAVGKMKKRT